MSLSYGFGLGDEDTRYNSKQFSDAMKEFTADGISHQYGNQFSLSLNGFTVMIGTGSILIDGRHIESSEPIRLSLNLPSSSEERTDAVAVKVDYTEKKVSVGILSNVNEAEIRANPNILHQENGYICILYFLHIRMGASSIEPRDVTDVRDDHTLCGMIFSFSQLTKNVYNVYSYVTVGFDRDTQQLLDHFEQFSEIAVESLGSVEKELNNLNVVHEIGELLLSRNHPEPEREWLLCNGEKVPFIYDTLSRLVDTLPDVSKPGDRYCVYMYGGTPLDIAVCVIDRSRVDLSILSV